MQLSSEKLVASFHSSQSNWKISPFKLKKICIGMISSKERKALYTKMGKRTLSSVAAEWNRPPALLSTAPKIKATKNCHKQTRKRITLKKSQTCTFRVGGAVARPQSYQQPSKQYWEKKKNHQDFKFSYYLCEFAKKWTEDMWRKESKWNSRELQLKYDFRESSTNKGTFSDPRMK